MHRSFKPAVRSPGALTSSMTELASRLLLSAGQSNPKRSCDSAEQGSRHGTRSDRSFSVLELTCLIGSEDAGADLTQHLEPIDIP